MSNKPKIDLDSAPKLERLPDSAYDDIEVEDNRFTANLFGTPEPDDNDYNHIVWDDLVPPEDEKVVTKIAAKERPASRPKRHEAIKEVEMLDQFIGLPDSVANTVIGRYAIGIATMLEFPEVSAFMTLMGCASASVSCNYAVQYRFGSATKKRSAMPVPLDSFKIRLDEPFCAISVIDPFAMPEKAFRPERMPETCSPA